MSERWTRPIDAYCERLDPSFWAEPVNAATNAAFLVAAAAGVVASRGGADRGVTLLAALTAIIGVGSFLFHTFATVWAALADVVPISLFIVVGLVLILRRLVGLHAAWAVGLGVAFLPASTLLVGALRPLADVTIGASVGYLPPLVALLACTAVLRRRRHPAAPALLTTAALFAVSLTFRTLDGPLCAAWPLGTHWLWHLLNAVVLARLMRTLAAFGPTVTHASKW